MAACDQPEMAIEMLRDLKIADQDLARIMKMPAPGHRRHVGRSWPSQIALAALFVRVAALHNLGGASARRCRCRALVTCSFCSKRALVTPAALSPVGSVVSMVALGS